MYEIRFSNVLKLFFCGEHDECVYTCLLVMCRSICVYFIYICIQIYIYIYIYIYIRLQFHTTFLITPYKLTPTSLPATTRLTHTPTEVAETPKADEAASPEAANKANIHPREFSPNL